MNEWSYWVALSRRDELLRQAANYRLTHHPRPRTAAPRKPIHRPPLKLRRVFLPKSA
jgi:hypothetical protein